MERVNAPAGVSLASLKPKEEPQDLNNGTILLGRQSGMSGISQPPYLATSLTVDRLQAALRSAERGDTYLYFTIVRDMIVGYSHLQAEWAKRKQVICGQPYSVLPFDKTDKDDVTACEVVKEAIDNCQNWEDGLDHLLDATLYPLAVAEKIWKPIEQSGSGRFKYLKRYTLHEIAPVDPTVLCFKAPYQPGFGGNSAVNFNADDWQSWLRFYKVDKRNGAVNRNYQDSYSPDLKWHIVYRGNFLSPTIPPNFGGQIRACLFWYLLAMKDRDWWGLMMSKYGMPIPVGKVDAQQKDTLQFMQNALALGMQIGGIVIDKKAELTLEQVNQTDGSNSHKIFSDFANCEISKLVVGQVLSSTPKNTGLGSGMADQAEGVREEIRISDQTKLRACLRRQLFAQILELNGYRGRPPLIYWGGIKPDELIKLSKSMAQFKQAGLQASEKGIITLNEKTSIDLEVAPEPVQSDDGKSLKEEMQALRDDLQALSTHVT